MRTFCGAVTEINDLGVVAEYCPHCDQLTRCLLRTITRGSYICFVKMAELSREGSCMCTGCLKTFPGKPYWTYASVASIRDAGEMPLDDLLTQTNPILADRIRFKEQIHELGGDAGFADAYEKVDGMRPGRLRSDLLRQLLEWPRLDRAQQDELRREIGSLSRAWQFARQMAVGFPASSGSLVYFIASLLVCLALVYALVTHNWLWGSIAAGAVGIATLVVEYILLRRSVCLWTQQVLIPEAQEDDVPLDRFVDVVDDVPGCKLGLTEGLWPMKHQLKTICETLTSQGKLPVEPCPETR